MKTKKKVVLMLAAFVVGACIYAVNASGLFVRYKMHNVDRTYALVSQVIHYDPWFRAHPPIPYDALAPLTTSEEKFEDIFDEDYCPPNRVKKNTYSPWGKVEGGCTTIVLKFFDESNKPLNRIEVEIQIATNADEKAVFKTKLVKEPGNIAGISMPHNPVEKPEEILTVREESEKHLRWAKEIVGDEVDKNIPKKIIFYTGAHLSIGGLYTDPEIAKNELMTLKTLGLNGIYWPGQKGYDFFKEVGFDDNYVDHNYYVSTPNLKDSDKVLFEKIKYVCMADEPGNDGYSIAAQKGPAYFHNYLQKNGFTPKDFNGSDWDDVEMLADLNELSQLVEDWGEKYAVGFRKLYYWSHRYSHYLLIEHYKEIRNKLEAFYHPGKPRMFVNYTSHPLILWGGMLNGQPDWFDLAFYGAFTANGTEDWLAGHLGGWGNGLWQRMGFLCDILRESSAKEDLPLVYYNVWGPAISTPLALAHGAKAIHYFYYGPLYAATENHWSENKEHYRQVAAVIRDVGKVEDFIYYGKPYKRQLAIIYSTTDEIWGPLSSAHEKMYVYIALAQEHYHADVLNETLLLDRDLSRYDTIYFMSKRLPLKVLMKLQDYVLNGGTLAVFPEVGTYDEYDTPTNIISKHIGAAIQSYTLSGSTNKIMQAVKPDQEVKEIEVIQRGTVATFKNIQSDTEVLYKYANGEPAIITRKVGKGKIVCFSFFPGQWFMDDLCKRHGNGPPFNPSPQIRNIISLPCKLADIKPALKLSAHPFESGLLLSDKGTALILINLNSTNKLANLNVAVKTNFVDKLPNAYSVKVGAIKLEKQEEEYIHFSLPFTNHYDFIVFSK